MTLVLDASVTLAWCLPDERTENTEALRARVAREGSVVPTLWRLEVANGLLMAMRRGRMDAAAALEMLSTLDEMEIDREPAPGGTAAAQAWNLAARHCLTLHDATYLELALRRRLPLATLDAALARAATAEGLAILP